MNEKDKKMVPAYPKIYPFGHPALANLFKGCVAVQEKVDGVSFSFGWIDGAVRMRSKHRQLLAYGSEGVLDLAVKEVRAFADRLVPNWIYHAEYLRTPQQKTITYYGVPKGHLALFDVRIRDRVYASIGKVQREAARLGIDGVPSLFYGHMNPEDIPPLVNTHSFLGGGTVEGIIVKNYRQICEKTGGILIGKYDARQKQIINEQDEKG